MTNITHPIFLEDYLDLDRDVERVTSIGPVTNIQPKRGKIDIVMTKLIQHSQNGQLFTPYRKELFPAKYHYANNRRVMDIVVVCQLGVYLRDVSI